MRMVCGTVKKALLTSINIGESTKARVGAISEACKAVVRVDDVIRRGYIERNATESHVYIHARVAWDYHLHANQLVSPKISMRHAYLTIDQSQVETNWGYCCRYW